MAPSPDVAGKLVLIMDSSVDIRDVLRGGEAFDDDGTGGGGIVTGSIHDADTSLGSQLVAPIDDSDTVSVTRDGMAIG